MSAIALHAMTDEEIEVLREKLANNTWSDVDGEESGARQYSTGG